ncbi:hypothetical protein IWQ61_010049 [Dispira simplex]|nr:hypothetical protein IWQ61_010049 [Dispira simplex]
MPPLAKVVERILAEAANEEYWAEEERHDEEDEDAGEDQKTRGTSKTEPKAEKSSDINQLMDQFEKIEQEADTAWKDVLYASGLGTVVSTLEGWKTKFTLDDGSEMNLMASDVAEELAQQGKLVIRKDIIWRVGDINGGQMYTKGVGTHCQVAIGDATILGHFFVTGMEKGLILLGAPWQRAARLEKWCGDNGAVWMRVKNYQSNAVVQFCAVPTKHP